MKETTKIWVPKGIKTKDIHRIIERYGYDNDTLHQELDGRNNIPYEITIIVKKVKGERKAKPNET